MVPDETGRIAGGRRTRASRRECDGKNTQRVRTIPRIRDFRTRRKESGKDGQGDGRGPHTPACKHPRPPVSGNPLRDRVMWHELNPSNPFIFRITSIRNLPWTLASGLYCRHSDCTGHRIRDHGGQTSAHRNESTAPPGRSPMRDCAGAGPFRHDPAPSCRLADGLVPKSELDGSPPRLSTERKPAHGWAPRTVGRWELPSVWSATRGRGRLLEHLTGSVSSL